MDVRNDDKCVQLIVIKLHVTPPKCLHPLPGNPWVLQPERARFGVVQQAVLQGELLAGGNAAPRLDAAVEIGGK